MSTFYSATTGGFYHRQLHAELPADAVAVSAREHSRLLAGQAEGRTIVARHGRPVLAAAAAARVSDVRDRLAGLTARETRTRILAVASLVRQFNDTAEIAMAALQVATAGATTIDTQGAIDRRVRIDGLLTIGADLQQRIAKMPARDLADFDPTDPTHWER